MTAQGGIAILKRVYEHRRQPLLPRRRFLLRLSHHLIGAAVFITISLGIGLLGYRAFEGMSWVDSFLNAAMLMGGMGPVGEIHTTGGKLFAGCYALYCGIVFIVTIGVILAPFFHRIIHRFHLEVETAEAEEEERRDGGAAKVPSPRAPGSR